jgi:citrate lyase beta subunit
MDAALADGVAATRSNGQMVDYAHVKTATALLERAEGYGVPVPAYPKLEAPLT